MIKTNYEYIPDKMFVNYLDYLIGKVYKMLPMRENKDDTLVEYMESIIREMIGNQQLMGEIKYDARFQSVINKLEYLTFKKDVDFKVFRKDILDSLPLLKEIKEQYEKEE